ncbi:YncE family protein [Flavobacterium sp.]|uniref:YncE family protein n=1 Tax=Flavobacterium sp. TaxID=239 RepID=UPI004034C8B9
MKINKLILTAIAGSLLFVSCSDDDSDSNTPSGAYDNGMLIINQGNFGQGNSTVSFLSDDLVLENNIFAAVNPGHILGDTAQDIAFKGDLAYIVLNFSNKIEIVNRYTFAHVGTINQGLDNPRYIAIHNNKAFVTNWGDGGVETDDYVAVINLSTNAVTSEIAVTEGPERILEEDGKLYVSHKGGYGYGNSITVINGSSNAVITTIAVGDVPNMMEEEDGKLYVMCEGKPSWAPTAETPGSLVVINLSNNTVTSTLPFTGTSHPSNLVIEDDKIYFTEGSDIYTMAKNATTLPSAPLFTTTEQGVYGVSAFAVEENHIYVGDATDFNSNGKVYVYSLAGALQNTFTVGITPAGFYFND